MFLIALGPVLGITGDPEIAEISAGCTTEGTQEHDIWQQNFYYNTWASKLDNLQCFWRKSIISMVYKSCN